MESSLATRALAKIGIGFGTKRRCNVAASLCVQRVPEYTDTTRVQGLAETGSYELASTPAATGACFERSSGRTVAPSPCDGSQHAPRLLAMSRAD